MRTPKTRHAARLNQLALPLLLLISACNADNSISPAAPDAAAPLDDTELSRHDCFSHHNDCASARNGRIAFSHFIDPVGFAIFSAAPDGSDLQQLTTPDNNIFDDVYPDWSPDGSNIIFERDYLADYTHQFFRINADGTGLTQLFICDGRCLGVANPVYSPDGRRIAFAQATGDETTFTVGMWIMNADGSNRVQVTQRVAGSGTEDQGATWSPDGHRLAFTRINDSAEPVGHQAIFVGDVNGTDAHRITPWDLNASATTWSPDGRQILITSHYDIGQDGQEQLYTVRPDGSGLARVRPRGLDQLGNMAAKFSPDGRKIVFTHRTDLTTYPFIIFDAYTMNADGSDVTKVSFLNDFYLYPDWGTHR